jgi:RNA polymerase sigma-70 factor (ECF subfamily)
MFRYAYYQFNFSKEKAEEITQEIFLKVWKNIDKFDTNTNFNAWIYRIAHNLILDSFKKKEINLVESNIQDLRLSKDFDENKHYLIENLLNKLDEKYKQLIILYYFEGKSYDEIAEIYTTNKNTV